jgi:hypothetical protein
VEIQSKDRAARTVPCGGGWALAMAMALVSIAGCSGSSGTTPPVGQVPVTQGAPNPNQGLLVVDVVDAFGWPALAAEVSFQSEDGQVLATILTGPDGRASRWVRAATGVVHVSHALGQDDDPTPVTVPKGGRIDLLRTVRTDSGPGPTGIAATRAAPGALSADGASFEFTISLYSLGGPASGPDLVGSSELSDVRLEDCVPRAGEGLAAHGAACVQRDDGTDRSWRMVEKAVDPSPWEGGDFGEPLAILLMLDRSQTATRRDGFDTRLNMAKSLASSLLPHSHFALAAFAGDGGPAGTASPLPAVPVTFLGDATSPSFSSREAAFAAIDGLRGLAGGSTPLHTAIAAGLEFMADKADPARRRALVVFADGRDDDCLTIEACLPASRSVAARARELGVRVFIVATAIGWDGDDGRLVLLALDREDGVVFILQPMSWDFPGATAIVRNALLGYSAYRHLRFRIAGEGPGSFRSGDLVQGVLQVTVPGGMNPMEEALGFSVRVP